MPLDLVALGSQLSNQFAEDQRSRREDRLMRLIGGQAAKGDFEGAASTLMREGRPDAGFAMQQYGQQQTQMSQEQAREQGVALLSVMRQLRGAPAPARGMLARAMSKQLADTGIDLNQLDFNTLDDATLDQEIQALGSLEQPERGFAGQTPYTRRGDEVSYGEPPPLTEAEAARAGGSTPADIQKYRLARSQGYEGSFTDFMKESRQRFSVETFGGNRYLVDNTGFEPPRLMSDLDDEAGAEETLSSAGARGTEVGRAEGEAAAAGVEGSEAALSAEEQRSQAIATAEGIVRINDLVVDDARRFFELDNVPFGREAAVQAMLPAAAQSDAYRNALALVESIKGNVGIDQLLRIKASGAGLGQIPQSQLDLLSRLMGELSLTQTQEQFEYTLARIEETYDQIADLAAGELEALGATERMSASRQAEAGGGSGIDPRAMEMLRSDPSPEAQAEFDEVFGDGAAAQVLGDGGGPATAVPQRYR